VRGIADAATIVADFECDGRRLIAQMNLNRAGVRVAYGIRQSFLTDP
jgi:hypothetical protein